MTKHSLISMGFAQNTGPFKELSPDLERLERLSDDLGNGASLSSYDPLNDSEYMSGAMLNYFKDTLTQMHKDILNKEESISLSLIDAPYREPDLVDQSTNEELHNEDFSFQEHEDRLRHEIELALQNINDGTYGYCEETGEPIGVRRLLSVPYARYCLKAQEHKEDEEKG